jgi:hypothetical protein
MKGIDLTSPTWRAIEQMAQKEIDTLRTRNDNFSMDALHTAELRGRIAAWKKLLALANPAPAPTVDAGGY